MSKKKCAFGWAFGGPPLRAPFANLAQLARSRASLPLLYRFTRLVRLLSFGRVLTASQPLRNDPARAVTRIPSDLRSQLNMNRSETFWKVSRSTTSSHYYSKTP
ncbi:BZ3501_MvSof-1269-A2-R1_Chr12-1g03340 [Microbotryum saponariae]|nr:BZ3501_MvSof-1269-A2-R1_Chr12-1g03340 [Microbotryum saponariae]